MKIIKAIRKCYGLCPGRINLTAVSALFIALHFLLRRFPAAMAAVSERAVRPFHRFMGTALSHLPFSMAELLIGMAALLGAGYLLYQFFALLLRKERRIRLFRTLMTVTAAAGVIYAGFCFLWGVYYYSDDLISRSGFEQGPVSGEMLESVTLYFAGLANEYSGLVRRNDSGFYDESRELILGRSADIFDAAETHFPLLEGPDIAAKGIHFSRIMSYTDFTGFFFPFTGEANVNTDFPVSLFAATIAHELSHQRGISREQEANFTAVLACLESGDTDYVYSAALMAYIYLGNALYGADYAAWERAYGTLNEDVRRDLAEHSSYWQQFETPVQTVSNTVYENFLYSYGQQLGLKSYGACVDLLVNYYYTGQPE